MTDLKAQIAAEAHAHAARTPGTRVVMVDAVAVAITGAEPLPGAVEAFVMLARGLDTDSPQPAAA